jgi:hypothetical protein
MNVGAGEKFVPQSIFMAPENSVRLFLQALFSGDGSVYHSTAGVFVEYYSKSRRLDRRCASPVAAIRHLFADPRENHGHWNSSLQNPNHDKDQIRRFAERVGFSPGSVKQQTLDVEVLPMIRAQPRRKSNFDTLPQRGLAHDRHGRASGRSELE